MNDWPNDIIELHNTATELLAEIESCNMENYREAIRFASNRSFQAAYYYYNLAITQFRAQNIFDEKYKQIKRSDKDVFSYDQSQMTNYQTEILDQISRAIEQSNLIDVLKK